MAIELEPVPFGVSSLTPDRLLLVAAFSLAAAALLHVYDACFTRRF
jgi:hypothetical protein